MLSFLKEEEARDHNISLCQIIAVYVVSSNRCCIVSRVQYRHNFHAHCTKHADTQKLETAEIVMPMHNTLGINAQLLSALNTPLPENINLIIMSWLNDSISKYQNVKLLTVYVGIHLCRDEWEIM